MKDLLKKSVAEVIGTFVLVFAAVGTAVFTEEIAATALAFGLVIVAMAYSIGRISGCHINPAVSLGCLLTGRMTLKEFLVYVGSQLLGAILGGVALLGVVKLSNISGFDFVHAGSNTYAGGWNNANAAGIIGALLTEIVLTCVFVYVILNVTEEGNTGIGKKAGLVIGLTLTFVHLVGIGITGTSVNPARSIGTALADFIYSGDPAALVCVWMSIVGPLVGACAAAGLYKVLHSKKQ